MQHCLLRDTCVMVMPLGVVELVRNRMSMAGDAVRACIDRGCKNEQNDFSIKILAVKTNEHNMTVRHQYISAKTTACGWNCDFSCCKVRFCSFMEYHL